MVRLFCSEQQLSSYRFYVKISQNIVRFKNLDRRGLMASVCEVLSVRYIYMLKRERESRKTEERHEKKEDGRLEINRSAVEITIGTSIPEKTATALYNSIEVSHWLLCSLCKIRLTSALACFIVSYLLASVMIHTDARRRLSWSF